MKILFLLLLTACTVNATPMRILPLLPSQTKPCLSGPVVIATNFAKPTDADYDRLMDKDLTTAVNSNMVNPGASVYIDIDYRCKYYFYEFQLRNMATKRYAFGAVTIYSSSDITQPWKLETTYEQGATIPADGFNWRYRFEVPSARLIRYVFTNNTRTTQQFTISDIETGAEQLPDTGEL